MRKSKFYQYGLFFVIVIIGLITIIATNGEKTVNFKTVKVYPLFRCPKDDVRAHWTTSPDTPIKIIYNDETHDAPGSGDYLINAEDVNALPNPVVITLKIDASNGESREFTVETIMGIETYSRTGLYISDTRYRFRIEFIPEIWSNDIIVHKIQLQYPQKYTCIGKPDEYLINWQYDKGTAVSGYLTADNGFQAGFDPQPTISGIWYFTMLNFGDEKYCPGWDTFPKAPTVVFQVSCK
ncbi:MAG: hypothetical protein A2X13_10615 [Bacteroidetes bacterium GWC2_33_15]|nr:MAG: hypothetical protein A2X10_03165 [Bacteroidetes bacterium GWA2_33_15]OFX48850.1 MAG: hypothetical protein A2X13_10615 [Bacteroidetes bacterium GWC2_33_15]OFX66093.1 MAG: hypothetical protein A2X15_11760 [Bacteroidetes bacterium GWB2_32_14]OFX68145.1 MAG: hypothetical protein A2X14_07135 [Bacteroidetes bacterium GWD2_33_33]HAN17917.1 hypothetical protein [Bacteroidales bacterium]